MVYLFVVNFGIVGYVFFIIVNVNLFMVYGEWECVEYYVKVMLEG